MVETQQGHLLRHLRHPSSACYGRRTQRELKSSPHFAVARDQCGTLIGECLDLPFVYLCEPTVLRTSGQSDNHERRPEHGCRFGSFAVCEERASRSVQQSR